jgi:hypothetical protein
VNLLAQHLTKWETQPIDGTLRATDPLTHAPNSSGRRLEGFGTLRAQEEITADQTIAKTIAVLIDHLLSVLVARALAGSPTYALAYLALLRREVAIARRCSGRTRWVKPVPGSP